jgi:wobble nucleotide-excising tRNase
VSNTPKVQNYQSLKRLVQRLRDDLNSHDFVLLYAYNGTGKTRLSMEFKDYGKKKNRDQADTLYYNAYTEDLFIWDNDLEGDTQRLLRLNADSRFFNGFKELELEARVFHYLERYANFEFKINYDDWLITFSPKGEQTPIKVSRGEENIFIWCIFLALCELVIDGAESYNWVKYLYIDDPVSSLDDNNTIALASDLAKLLKKGKGRIKAVISSHHGLFFNVMWNEFRSASIQYKTHFYYRSKQAEVYSLQSTDDTPFFHHVAMLSELQQASDSGRLYTHHFNMLRSIMEKTASFFGYSDFSACIHGVEDEVLYARALNLLSHGRYSAFQPREMVEDTKLLFQQILNTFLERYQFQLPALTKDQNSHE